MTFSAADPATWPMTLTPDHLAQIYHRSAAAVVRQIQRQYAGPVSADRLLPMPFLRRPMRWRKDDVKGHVTGARQLLRKVG